MNSHAAASTSRHGVGTAITSPNPSGSRKTTSLNNNVKRGFDPTSSNDRDIPCVEERVAESLSVWAKELRALFDHAKERFGDVTWENEDDSSGRSRIWGHKAVIYARAPKAFKDRYFISRPFSRSPASLRSPSPSFPSQFPDTPSSPHPSSATNSFHRPSPVPAHSGRTSTLSVNTIKSEGTLRANGDGVLRLTHGDTPELFQAQLEWLYTGEGFGDVVEWISAEDDSGIGGSIRDSLGRRGNLTERRDKLGQDLTYMWRSKLYADARIHLAPPLPGQEDSSSSDSDDSSDSLSSTAVFTAHRFILASRSPYFASVLLNGSTFKPHTSDIHLPTPPFTPAALHFCLGYIYAGHLDFSNRTFDLITAFAIHRAASYLQLDTLQAEIESRIAHEFCHAFDPAKVHCRRCPARIARVWRFASSPDVGSVDLLMKSRAYVVRRWGDTWGRDVALAEPQDRQALVKDVVTSIGPRNIVAAFRSLGMIQDRIDHAVRSKGRAWTAWAEPIEEMLQVIQKHVQTILVDRFAEVAESPEFWHLVSGQGFSHDLLETISKALVESVGTAQECVEGPRIYQALVSSLLLRVEPNTLQTALPPRSRGRLQIEEAKEGILGHVRRRWMQIRDGGGQSKTTPRRAKPDKPVRTVPTPKSARKVEEESRIRKLSTASTASTRGKAFRKGESPPPLPLPSSVISPSLHSPTSQSNLPPPVSMARAGRKISTSSAKSNQSYRAHPASAFDPPRRPLIVNLPEKQAPEGTTPFQGRGVALRMGIPCIVSLKSKRARFRAMVKYIGHIQDSRGPWLGIETEELDRFNVSTLDSGSLDGIHYFHLSSQEGNMEDVDVRLARQRRIEVIREGLERPVGLGLGTIGRHRAAGLPAPGTFGLGVDNLGTKRSKSPTPFTDGFGTIVNPRVLFVRPSEVVFVLGAE
ncbi:hypothetical protein BD324DRAFT_583444 [Kockovaella imperatae]|uniref:BTB domain-containing protein n=1 Tax=Kockovaella imperatae TaxID=4999 RepID=A0A1Y1U8I2_9TREE|nr:hypothetical protein BD324DRAFT_583444 [Kockovaella imperatae]ORX34351.1 hypothetical protein BD324DRAFT_583444 [Kockovaella imperatae]